MESSLVYLDRRAGTMCGELKLASAFHQLGIRHLDVAGDGTVAAAMQYEGPSSDLVPLVALHRPEEKTLEFLNTPDDTLRSLRNYCGSAAMNGGGFMLSSGTGAILSYRGPIRSRMLPVTIEGGVHWDNHMVAADL